MNLDVGRENTTGVGECQDVGVVFGSIRLQTCFCEDIFVTLDAPFNDEGGVRGVARESFGQVSTDVVQDKELKYGRIEGAVLNMGQQV